MAKKSQPTSKPKGVEQAYQNAPGKPIIHNGCSMCGLLGGHTATCPNGANVPRRTPLDPL